MEPYTLVQSKEKTCPHGIAVRFDCYQCAFNQVRQAQQGVCSHWIPKGQPCYACERQKGRENPFTERPYIPVDPKRAQNNCQPNQEFMQQQLGSDQSRFGNQMLPSMVGYTHPDDPNRDFPQPVNTVGGGRYRPPADPRRAMSSGREQTQRSRNEGPVMGYAMDRSLDESKFMQEQQGHMWGNPLIRRNFPSPMEQKLEPQEEQTITNYGVSTRKSRKIDPSGRNENIFLNRSMVQPDMRHGNRFYEYMPQTDRVSGQRRESDNMMANQFQQQSAQMYSEMDYQRAFDTGAAVGRGGQARWDQQ